MKIISIDTLREERRRQTVEVGVPYSFAGEMRSVKKRIVNGEMDVFELARPMGEMITTPEGLDQLIQNSIINLELGREAVPLLYGPIYRRVEDANFSEYVDIWPFIGAQVVFLAHLELEEVKFGTRRIGTKDTVPIISSHLKLRPWRNRSGTALGWRGLCSEGFWVRFTLFMRRSRK